MSLASRENGAGANVVLSAIDICAHSKCGTPFSIAKMRARNATAYLAPLVCSFLRHVRGHLVLFVAPAEAVEEVRATFAAQSRLSVHPIETRGWVQLFRYEAYASWLEQQLRGHESRRQGARIGRQLGKVAVSDAIDVVFQGDPFAEVGDDEHEVCFGREISCIGCSTGNKHWVRQLYGPGMLAKLSKETTSCSGFTMGGAKGVAVYLRHMADEIHAKLLPRLPNLAHEHVMLAKGYDQGVHNVLLHTAWLLTNGSVAADGSRAAGSLHARLLPVNGAIFTEHRMVLGKHYVLEGAVVVRQHDWTDPTVKHGPRRPFAVVHQYGRLFHGQDRMIREAAIAKCR